ncbi:gliding motility lipoprotein GldB [Flavobacteriaceae bacterium XHP0103]|uniref:gliding motility lipoprotein GldB n=1 Tax=Marixanthotalea marina TaxID=2844359 RepID=UPI002989E0D7|nr:gliding motility lipoprotein GldB [Marixanthotalea marina]MBU3821217.1 gliding motility lipoprotein GldB [Marixanthotalea marina]
MKRLLLPLILTVFIVSCNNNDKVEKEISNINTEITIERFDELFDEVATPADLKKLQTAYPFMFSEKYSDTFWIEKVNDTLQKQLVDEVAKQFQDMDATKQEIESLFNHLKYYFPNFSSPRVITVTSYVDYRNKVIVTDSIALISLDTYLGSDHEFYQGIQKYIAADMNKEQIVVDMADEYAKKFIYRKDIKTFLDEMVYHGKLLYFKDAMVPFKTEAERIGYTQEQLDWAQANESYIWRYFVERELLYSTDSKLPGRFIIDAPFSKFYLEEIDAQSPDKLGQYIGWQIVRAYMENNDVPLMEMFDANTEEIFNNSKFKPRK